MATDWAADVKKYVANANDAAIAGIVSYCGIALRTRDSALVAFSDKAETDRVRTNFLKKKLGRTEADSVLDAAIAKVGEKMKADRTKNRVTVYYLLAAEFNQLETFVKKAAAKPPAAKAPAAKAPAAKAAPAKAPAAKPIVAKPPAKTAAKAVGAAALVGATAAAKAPAKKAAAPKTKTPAKPAATPKAATAPTKKAAPAVKAAAKPVAKTPIITTKKSASTKAAVVTGAAMGLVDKTAAVASDASKATTAAVTATVAAVGAAAGLAAAAAGGAASAVTGAAGSAIDGAAGAVSGAANDAMHKGAAMLSGGKPSAATGKAEDDSGMGWLMWLLAAAALVFALWWFLHGRGDDAAPVAAGAPTEAAMSNAAAPADTSLAAAPAEGTVAIPAGEGVTTEMRDGKPVVKVYFASGQTTVASAFAPAAAGLNAWLASHSGATLEVSGYADPSGNAALNAQLSKQRAQAVQADLVKSGIAEGAVALVKPAASTDATVSKEAARRVEVVVK